LNRTHLLSTLSVAVLSLAPVFTGGCVATTGSPEEIAPGATTPAGHVHLMLTDQERELKGLNFQPERVSARTLRYYGGPVVQNVAVHPVYWNSSVQNQSSLSAFYSALVKSTEMTFLSQYDTTSPAQTIGNGTFTAAHVASQTGTSVTDTEVQSFLTSAFTAGTLPKPTSNTYYPVHFPSGVSISDGSGNTSCVQFCAYHGTGTYNGQDFYYGVLPDLSQSGCAGGCGGSTVVNNETSVASHEFAETVTDPAIGLATTYGPPLGWYNANYGEIGDICNGQQTTAVLGDGKSYTVQKLWSNKNSACVTP
jgi:hypothetical protein